MTGRGFVDICPSVERHLSACAGSGAVRSCGLAFEEQAVRGAWWADARDGTDSSKGSREIAHRRARGMRTSGACDARCRWILVRLCRTSPANR